MNVRDDDRDYMMDSRYDSKGRSSILKPPKARVPLVEVDFGNHDDYEELTDVSRKRRVSFAGVNKIKEFSSKAESFQVLHTPAYEEKFSISSDSCDLTSSVKIANHVHQDLKNICANIDVENIKASESISSDNMDLTNPLSCEIEDGDIPQNFGNPNGIQVPSNLWRSDMDMTQCRKTFVPDMNIHSRVPLVDCQVQAKMGNSKNIQYDSIYNRTVEVSGIAPLCSTNVIENNFTSAVNSDCRNNVHALKFIENHQTFEDSVRMEFTQVVTGYGGPTPIHTELSQAHSIQNRSNMRIPATNVKSMFVNRKPNSTIIFGPGNNNPHELDFTQHVNQLHETMELTEIHQGHAAVENSIVQRQNGLSAFVMPLNPYGESYNPTSGGVFGCRGPNTENQMDFTQCHKTSISNVHAEQIPGVVPRVINNPVSAVGINPMNSELSNPNTCSDMKFNMATNAFDRIRNRSNFMNDKELGGIKNVDESNTSEFVSNKMFDGINKENVISAENQAGQRSVNVSVIRKGNSCSGVYLKSGEENKDTVNNLIGFDVLTNDEQKKVSRQINNMNSQKTADCSVDMEFTTAMSNHNINDHHIYPSKLPDSQQLMKTLPDSQLNLFINPKSNNEIYNLLPNSNHTMGHSTNMDLTNLAYLDNAHKTLIGSRCEAKEVPVSNNVNPIKSSNFPHDIGNNPVHGVNLPETNDRCSDMDNMDLTIMEFDRPTIGQNGANQVLEGVLGVAKGFPQTLEGKLTPATNSDSLLTINCKQKPNPQFPTANEGSDSMDLSNLIYNCVAKEQQYVTNKSVESAKQLPIFLSNLTDTNTSNGVPITNCRQTSVINLPKPSETSSIMDFTSVVCNNTRHQQNESNKVLTEPLFATRDFNPLIPPTNSNTVSDNKEMHSVNIPAKSEYLDDMEFTLMHNTMKDPKNNMLIGSHVGVKDAPQYLEGLHAISDHNKSAVNSIKTDECSGNMDFTSVVCNYTQRDHHNSANRALIEFMRSPNDSTQILIKSTPADSNIVPTVAHNNGNSAVNLPKTNECSDSMDFTSVVSNHTQRDRPSSMNKTLMESTSARRDLTQTLIRSTNSYPVLIFNSDKKPAFNLTKANECSGSMDFTSVVGHHTQRDQANEILMELMSVQKNSEQVSAPSANSHSVPTTSCREKSVCNLPKTNECSGSMDFTSVMCNSTQRDQPSSTIRDQPNTTLMGSKCAPKDLKQPLSPKVNSNSVSSTDRNQTSAVELDPDNNMDLTGRVQDYNTTDGCSDANNVSEESQCVTNELPRDEKRMTGLINICPDTYNGICELDNMNQPNATSGFSTNGQCNNTETTCETKCTSEELPDSIDMFSSTKNSNSESVPINNIEGSNQMKSSDCHMDLIGPPFADNLKDQIDRSKSLLQCETNVLPHLDANEVSTTCSKHIARVDKSCVMDLKEVSSKEGYNSLCGVNNSLMDSQCPTMHLTEYVAKCEAKNRIVEQNPLIPDDVLDHKVLEEETCNRTSSKIKNTDSINCNISSNNLEEAKGGQVESSIQKTSIYKQQSDGKQDTIPFASDRISMGPSCLGRTVPLSVSKSPIDDDIKHCDNIVNQLSVSMNRTSGICTNEYKSSNSDETAGKEIDTSGQCLLQYENCAEEQNNYNKLSGDRQHDECGMVLDNSNCGKVDVHFDVAHDAFDNKSLHDGKSNATSMESDHSIHMSVKLLNDQTNEDVHVEYHVSNDADNNNKINVEMEMECCSEQRSFTCQDNLDIGGSGSDKIKASSTDEGEQKVETVINDHQNLDSCLKSNFIESKMFGEVPQKVHSTDMSLPTALSSENIKSASECNDAGKTSEPHISSGLSRQTLVDTCHNEEGSCFKANCGFMAQLGFKHSNGSLWKRSFLSNSFFLYLDLPSELYIKDTCIHNIFFEVNKECTDGLLIFLAKVLIEKYSRMLKLKYKLLNNVGHLVENIKEGIAATRSFRECVNYFRERYPVAVKDCYLEFYVVNIQHELLYDLRIDMKSWSNMSGKNLTVSQKIGKVDVGMVRTAFSLLPNGKEKLYRFAVFLDKNCGKMKIGK